MARRRLASPGLPFPDPAPPLDNDDLLREILLLLPPQPSSLLRASVVCKRWRRLVSDPGFLRRFRAHHRKPPFLGLFSVDTDGFCPFIPTLDPLDRIPAARFSLPWCCRHQSSHFVECRHGLALFLDRIYPEAVVWNPISGHQRRVTFPPEFGNARDRDILCSAVLCAAGEDDNGHVHGDCDLNSFKLALLRRGEQDRTIVFACLYESKSGEWGNVISTSITTTALFVWRKPSVLVGDALCWLLGGGGIKGDILELDFEMQKLVVIDKPGDSSLADCVRSCLQIIQIEESNLGLIIHTGPSLRLWEHKVNYDDVATWILHKTIDLVEHLSIVELKWSLILLYDKDHNVIFLWAPYADSSFMIQLDSIQFGNCYRTNFEATISQKSKFCYTTCVPYTSFYTADWATGGRVDGPEMLSSTRPDCPNR